MPIDMSMASKAPPAKSAGTARARAPKASITDQREQAMLGLFQGGQALCLILKQYADAAAIGQHAQPISHEVSVLASSDDRVAKAVDSLLVVGPYSALVMAVLPLALQLGVNHGLLPSSKIPGTVAPQVLSMRVEAEMTQQAADMMQEARLAQEQAQARIGQEAGIAPNGSEAATG